jgi:hypothetical protein
LRLTRIFVRAYSAFISPVPPPAGTPSASRLSHAERVSVEPSSASIERTGRFVRWITVHHRTESRTQNFQNDTPALSIAGPQDERWPVAAVGDSDLRLEVVFTLTGGTTSIAEIVPHTAQTHRLRDSMLASCQHPRP